MGVFVKICGCASRDDCAAVAACQPDAMGFILWPGSKRYVRPVDVGEWAEVIPPSIKKVGVFVNAAVDDVRRAAEEARLDVVQLHGEEPPAMLDGLRGIAVWKAIHLNRSAESPWLNSDVETFLLDYHSGTQPGGTGQLLDWASAARVVRDTSKKVLLAGGLNKDNVSEAVKAVRPWGVDVSSGVEATVGVKDMEKVKGFIEACRNKT